jgi:predicted hotdog family 3-hydroxylacyl-ACP dehydratase
MDFTNTPIKRIIPQRPPFMVVDRVTFCDETDATTEYTVADNSILLDGNTLSAAGVIENMAQSCAARMGCVDLLHGEPIKIGYIGDVKDAKIFGLPAIGDTIQTNIHIIEDILNLLLAEVCVTSNGHTIATARVKVARTDIIANLTE